MGRNGVIWRNSGGSGGKEGGEGNLELRLWEEPDLRAVAVPGLHALEEP